MNSAIQISRSQLPVEERGHITVEVVTQENPLAVLTLGHGAGSNLDQAFLKQLSTELASRRIATIRFNFLYSEQKKKMPDRFPAASAAIRAVFQLAKSSFADVPLFAGGKSFGGRMSSMTLSEGNPGVEGIIFYGFPLHPAGSPSVERADHLAKVGIPMLFIQGTTDALATPDLLRPIVTSLPGATLHEIEGADHSFKGGGSAGGVKALAGVTAAWVETLLERRHTS